MSEIAGFLREEIALRATVADKRRLAHDLRETRHHLAVAGGLGRSVEQDLIRAYAANVLAASPYSLLLAVVVLTIATMWQPWEALLPGGLLVSGALLAIAIGCHRFGRLRDGAALRTWRIGFIVAELLLGAGWLAAFLPFLGQADGHADAAAGQTFVLFAALMIMGTGAILRAPLPPAVYAGMVPLTVVVLTVALHGSGDGDVALALLALSGQLFILYFVGHLHAVAMATCRGQAELRASFAELEQIRANTIHARQRAEEAERAKAQFLATVSHELRTPLNAILGFSEVMKNEVLGSHSTPSYREYSSDIHGSGQQLLALINEILELSRIESGRYELSEEWAGLGEVVRAAVKPLQEQAEAKEQILSLAVDPELQDLWIDPRAVRQIVLNLLSNAIKFTPAGGHITVKAGWTSSGGQYVSVADDGPGIPEDEIPVVLSSFGRGTLAVETAAQGVGLGLPIARGLTELHGGRFRLTSKPRGGTEAVAVFPASRSEASRPPEEAAPKEEAA